jgi:hypothetical protein
MPDVNGLTVVSTTHIKANSILQYITVSMPNYKNSKVYELVSPGMPPYIGCTTQALSKRLTQHVSSYKKYGLSPGGSTSRYLIHTGQYEIFLIEDCPCDRKEQLRVRERFYIESCECVNKSVPGRTKKESDHAYYQSNTKKIIAHVSKQIQCTVCSCMVQSCSIKRHQRTKRCKAAASSAAHGAVAI